MQSASGIGGLRQLAGSAEEYRNLLSLIRPRGTGGNLRYFLIDRVVSLEKDLRISAIKNVALSEDIYSDHFPGKPVMPGAMQLEALAQAGTILLEASSKLRQKALLIMVNDAKFRHIVRPGDQLSVLSTIVSSDSNLAKLNGEIVCDGRTVTNASLTFALKPFEEIYHPRLHQFAQLLYASLLEDAKLTNLDREDFL
jgi:3-hydroxymyristoyl/3-hydroxydecanoyl-(acyl carrier protein) dehydratase